ncbi:hypothetical protein [Shimia biformata]|uniref:hypothetical protein n=1 Tax=Shimia biformata TaxID=1294299 RepID=UPI001950EB90|nr:hypothetical protein [Shimia biformata]
MKRTKDLSSPIFTRATRGGDRLSSPFAKNFRVDEWKEALEEAEGNERDVKLCMSAIFFGNQVSSLRDRHIKRIFKDISKRSALILAVGSANRNYFALIRDFRERQAERAKSKDSSPFHLMEIGKAGSQIAPQENMSPDDLVTAIVDTLPHWFFEAKELSDDREPIGTDFGLLELRAGWALSVESGLRDLWMSALWEGRELKGDGEGLTFGPADRELDGYWYASQMRTEAALWGPLALFHDLPEDRDDTQDIRSVFVSRLRGGRTGLAFPKPSGGRLQKLNETLGVLERSYIGDYLDVPIEVAGSEISMRLLIKALWVLGELGAAMRLNIRARIIRGYRDAREFSLRVSKKDCVRVFRECLGIEESFAASVLSQLVLSPDDTGKCFKEGVWLHPLVELDEEHVMIVMPSVDVGTKTRFVERTLTELLGPDLTKAKSLGGTFEKGTRKRVQAALAGNKIIDDFACLPHAINKVSEGGEEIDLLFRIGRRVIVGELKCLIAPNESIERYSHLSKLEEAAGQARRKAEWLSKNKHLVEDALDVDGAEIEITPMVILNQRIGSGLVIDEVVITDVFLLELFAGDGSYSSGAAMTKGRKAVAFETFYTTQKEAEDAIQDVFSSPPPLRPFIEGIEWVNVEFPAAFGKIRLETPRLKDGALVTPDLETAADIFSLDEALSKSFEAKELLAKGK